MYPWTCRSIKARQGAGSGDGATASHGSRLIEVLAIQGTRPISRARRQAVFGFFSILFDNEGKLR